MSLFARAGRGLTLTSAGRVFLSHAERVTEAADDALASVGRRHAAREQVVTMGTFRNAPYYEIAELATRYCDRHPEARLRLRGQNSYDVARAVQDGELEAVNSSCCPSTTRCSRSGRCFATRSCSSAPTPR